MIEIALHEIGTAKIDLFLPIVMKIIEPTVFQVTPDNADHGDILTHALDPWPQATHTAHQQVDLDAGPGGFVEHLDKTRVHNRIDLEDQVSFAAGLGMFNLPANQFLQSTA